MYDEIFKEEQDKLNFDNIISGFIFCIGIILFFKNDLYQIKKGNHV